MVQVAELAREVMLRPSWSALTGRRWCNSVALFAETAIDEMAVSSADVSTQDVVSAIQQHCSLDPRIDRTAACIMYGFGRTLKVSNLVALGSAKIVVVETVWHRHANGIWDCSAATCTALLWVGQPLQRRSSFDSLCTDVICGSRALAGSLKCSKVEVKCQPHTCDVH